ncbi:LysM peptidoglycan-binding domain-containing protein [Patescibacteria group bacterium]|nr:LysM peptidoglycan-binding domain-containing protein [Patescibacteria group bacterium]
MRGLKKIIIALTVLLIATAVDAVESNGLKLNLNPLPEVTLQGNEKGKKEVATVIRQKGLDVSLPEVALKGKQKLSSQTTTATAILATSPITATAIPTVAVIPLPITTFEYVVKKGDSLSSIAKEHGTSLPVLLAIQKKGDLKTLNRIYSGQRIKVPEKSKVVKTKIETKIFIWKKGGLKPFGKRNAIEGIKKFNLPEEVKQAFLFAVKSKKEESCLMKIGQRFEQTLLGNYKVVNNVEVQLPVQQLAAMLVAKFVHQGQTYFLIRPLICNNWAWWKEALPLPLELTTPPPSPSLKLKWKRLNRGEAYLWLGGSGVEKNDGEGYFLGGKYNKFFVRRGKFVLCFGATANSWKGISRDGFHYEGVRWSIGPVLKFTHKKGGEIIVAAQFGQQQDDGNTGDKKYVANQDTDVLAISLSTDFVTKIRLMKKVDIWGDYVLDVGHAKESTWESREILKTDDPASDKTSISLGVRTYCWGKKKMKGGILMKVSYANEDFSFGKSVGLFATDKKDIVKLNLEVRHTSGSKYGNGNLISLGLDIDPRKLIKK